MVDPRNVYEWFDRSADAFGDHAALEVGGRRLTYAALRDLAERLASRLVEALGRSPARPAAARRVGLLASRSVTAYAGYLAVLRAGATVVPLSPEHPASRNRGIVEAAGIDLLVTDAEGAGAGLGAPELAVDADGPSGRAEYRDVRPDDIAYIIFTSGSTGVPKGVPITHRNLGSYLEQVASRYEIGPGSRVSANFDLTFDGSVHDLFVTWARGGTLVVPQRSQLLSPVKTINALRLTHWFSVPSLISFAARLGTLEPGSMPTLKWSLFGGEALTLEAARQWRAAAPDSRLEVLYGPTELTIACTAYRLPPDPADWPRTPNGTVPIGTCHPTLEFLVLDEAGGELCVRGPQRFPGYLDPANNTDDHFLRATDGTDDWYRTGDRVARQDGLLIHLGRVDDQVKIHGHRVELGEIEAVLRRLPGVREATVLAMTAAGGEPELVAAVAGSACVPERLYSALGHHLPSYMLPRRITVLDQMPLNDNGKIDRRSLLTALGHTR